MEKFLRDWRQDALNKHQYDSAIFIGDKLLALTSMLPNPFPGNFDLLINPQITTKTPSGWHKSTLAPGITHARNPSSKRTTS
jgi:anaphase-promoting complex subunit 6